MIDIYTEKKDSRDWILQNDLYFNLLKLPIPKMGFAP